MTKEKYIIIISLICIFIFFAAFFVFAWQEPTSNPPGGNVLAPINTGSSGQYKIGRFQIGNSATSWINDSISGFSEPVVSNDGFIFIGGYTGAEDSDLRLYILDNANDRFSIWGNSCGGGNCGELNAASLAHYFTAGGDAWHKGKMTAAEICLEGKGCKSDWSDIAGSSYWTLSGTKLYPNNTGWNVGIGTTNPGSYKLYVNGSLLAGSGSRFNVGEGLVIQNGADLVPENDAREILLDDGNPPTDGSLIFTRKKDSSGNREVILKLNGNNGNVGIGTTNPTQKLDIRGWLTVGGHWQGDDFITFEQQGSFHRISFRNLHFYEGDYGDIVTFNNGRVGIGTTSPATKLHISLSNGGILRLSGTSSGRHYQFGITSDGRLYLAPYDDGGWQWGREFGYHPANNNWYIETALRVPKIIDSNNTDYYVDPASTSKFNCINLGGVTKCNWPSGGVSSCSDCDSRFVNVSGDTMTGNLTINKSYYSRLTIKSNDYWAGIEIRTQSASEGHPHIDFTNNHSDNYGVRIYAPNDNKLTITGGDLEVNKITVNQIDPVYKIKDKKYVTYMPDMIGQKVEVVGEGKTQNGIFEVDLAKQKEGSDLWLFYNVVKEETIIPFVSPQSAASLYAYIDGSKFVVKVKEGSKNAKFSYRLIGTRKDYQRTDNLLEEETSIYIDIDSLEK